MTILYAGGELDDFVLTGGVTAATSTAFYRSTYARCAVFATNSSTDGVAASFTASSAFSVTFQSHHAAALGYGTNPFLSLRTGGSARLRLRFAASGGSTTNRPVILESVTSGGVATTLATSVTTLPQATTRRWDVIVDYQVAGRVRVYIDNVSLIDYSGDVTASSATTLDSLFLQCQSTSASNNNNYYSEVIVCTQDSRTLSLVTLAPNAAGTTSSWTGAYTDIDEVTASDVDVLTSATANQVTSVNTTGMPSGWSNLTVVAVKCIANAARGSTGPSKLALGVRTNSSDSFPTATTLDTGFSTPVTTYYELNPVTGIAWTTTEIDALQLAFRSET